MKICFVTTSFIRSSQDHYARFVHDQAKSVLAADGATRVIVVAPHGPGLAVQEAIDRVEIERVRYFWPWRLQQLAYQHEGLFKTLRRSGLGALQLPLLVVAMMVRLWRVSKGAHIIHAQWLPTAAVAIVVGWLRRVPVVVSVRGADINTLRGSAIGRGLGRAVLGRVNHVMTVSDEFRELLGSENGSQAPVTALYNGVDVEQFRPRDRLNCRRALGLPGERPALLYVGGLIERKGLDTLLDAMTLLSSAALPPNLYLLGEGPQLRRLKKLATASGLATRVHFVGKVLREHVPLWMGAADLLVLPSFSEGRPNVVLEAMACGLPVVATSVNGTAELIRDGEDGLLFHPGDVQGLVTCIQTILEQPDKAAQFSLRGPERIRALGLTWSAHGRQLLSIYQQVIATA